MSKDYPIAVYPLVPADGEGFIAFVFDLPGCSSTGKTPEEALAGVQQAILEWIDEAKAQGWEIPEPGSAIARQQRERAALVAQLRSQKQAFDTLERELKTIRANVQSLLEKADYPDEAGMTPWIQGGTIYLSAAGKKLHPIQ